MRLARVRVRVRVRVRIRVRVRVRVRVRASHHFRRHAASLSCSYKSVLLLVPQPRPVAGLQAKGTAPVIRCLRWFSFFPS